MGTTMTTGTNCEYFADIRNTRCDIGMAGDDFHKVTYKMLHVILYIFLIHSFRGNFGETRDGLDSISNN